MGDDRTPPERRATVAEAAELLGISAEAVRSRIKRGTLESVKEGPHVFVLLRPAQTPPEQGPDAAQSAARSQSQPDALISELRAHNETLRQQLEAERQAHAEARRLLLSALEKIPPAIEPSAGEPPGAPTEATEQPGRVEPQPSVEGAQRPAERRSWWRRFFGFE